SVTPNLRSTLMGEALFLRAFCHLYLTQLFGDVPLVRTSDYRRNVRVSRTPQTEVYESIIDDLSAAKQLLPDEYPSDDRVRANKGAATALLARVYLYSGDFFNGETEASAIIAMTDRYELHVDLTAV